MHYQFYFVAHNRNHVRLLAPVAERVRQIAPVRFVELEEVHYNEGARDALQDYSFEVLTASQFDAALSSRAVIVVCNDWAPGALVATLQRARSIGAISIGVVEGCRFAMPHRYQTVDHVFALGPSSVGLFKQPTRIVGSPIVEAAAWDQKWCQIPVCAAINYKFTYDALEKRDEWLQAAMVACHEVGIDCALSQHPSDRSSRSDHTFHSIDELLRAAAVLITRSSTTVYEALARYKAVILFPVEGERLFEFSDADGAFPIAFEAESLPHLIDRALEVTPSNLAAGQRFLHRHISVGQPGDAVRAIADNLIDVARHTAAQAT